MADDQPVNLADLQSDQDQPSDDFDFNKTIDLFHKHADILKDKAKEAAKEKPKETSYDDLHPDDQSAIADHADVQIATNPSELDKWKVMGYPGVTGQYIKKAYGSSPSNMEALKNSLSQISDGVGNAGSSALSSFRNAMPDPVQPGDLYPTWNRNKPQPVPTHQPSAQVTPNTGGDLVNQALQTMQSPSPVPQPQQGSMPPSMLEMLRNQAAQVPMPNSIEATEGSAGAQVGGDAGNDSPGVTGGNLGAMAGMIGSRGPASKVPSAPQPQSMTSDDSGTDALGTRANLQDAQNRAAGARFVNEIGRAGELIGSGIAHTKPVAQQVFEDQAKASDKIVQDFKDQVENEKNDPNSPTSQQFRAYARKYAPNIGDDVTAADGEKLFPYMFKDFESKQEQVFKDKELNQKISAQAQQHADANDLKQTLLDGKNQDNQSKAYSELTNKIEQTKSRGATKNAWEADRLISNAQGLLSEYPDLNQVPQAQVSLFAQELGKIAKGGVAGEQEVKDLITPTYASHLQAELSKLENQPTGANLGAFLAEQKKYLDTLGANSKRVIGQSVGNLVAGYKRRVNPDDYSEINDRFKDYLTPNSKGSSNSVPQNSAALQRPSTISVATWTQLNPAEQADVISKLGQ